MLFYCWKLSVRTKDWHSYGHRRSFMLGKLLSKYVQQLTFIGSPRASNFLRISRFIENLCTVNDDGDFSSSYKYIYPQQIELKLEHQGYWTCNSLWFGHDGWGFYICISAFRQKGQVFFLHWTYSLSADQYFIINILWFNIFGVPTNSLIDTTERFCAQDISIIYKNDNTRWR